jgi:hypothetical protein
MTAPGRWSAPPTNWSSTVEHRVLGDGTWRALAAELTDNQLVEFCMLVGHYVMVAMTINACDLELEPGYLEAQPDAGGPAHG